jgi:hypothetical protein
VQSNIIARAVQERRVRSTCAVADIHCQWTRRTAPAAQEQQRGVRPVGRRREAQIRSTGHIVRQPGGHVQEQDHLGNI